MEFDANTLQKRFREAGQEQVFAHYNELEPESQQALLAQAALIDLDEVDNLNATLVKSDSHDAVDLQGIEPAPFTPLPRNGGDAAQWRSMVSTGETALREGRVAAFTVAGGQGTRLGFNGPKGTFPVSPVRQATLFQIFAEKLQYARKHYGKTIHWYIMTSQINHEATEAFFREKDWFGLGADNVHLFRQGLMPAVDNDGKILLEDRHVIAMSPDGHGGSLRALVRSGSIQQMAEQGVDVISYFQVDNPLVKVIDPAFIGFHLDTGSEMSSKALPKAYPGEKVGHFCQRGDTTCVIEYSDMPEALQEERDSSGELRFRGGSIAIHILDRDFVARMGGDRKELALPFHRANKKIAVYDPESGKSVKPSEPNGIKFEMFVFDALPFAKNPVIIETAREDDFSPVKNAEGVDSPKTACEDQLREFTRWLKAADVAIETDETGLPAFTFEIAPTFADSEVNFVAAWKALDTKPTISEGTVLE